MGVCGTGWGLEGCMCALAHVCVREFKCGMEWAGSCCAGTEEGWMRMQGKHRGAREEGCAAWPHAAPSPYLPTPLEY